MHISWFFTVGRLMKVDRLFNLKQMILTNQVSAIDAYLEYVNDWLTISRMAEYYGVSESYLESKINQGRKEHALKSNQ